MKANNQRAVAKVAPMFRQIPDVHSPQAGSVKSSPVKSAPSTPTKKRRHGNSAANAVVNQYIKTEPAIEFEEETIMVDGRPMLKCPSCDRTFPFRCVTSSWWTSIGITSLLAIIELHTVFLVYSGRSCWNTCLRIPTTEDINAIFPIVAGK